MQVKNKIVAVKVNPISHISFIYFII